MSEVPNFRLPFKMDRLMCHNCTLVDTYYVVGPFKCKHCGYKEATDSTGFEDEWNTHHKNIKSLAEAEELVDRLKNETEKFEKGWFSTWNSHTTEQIDFETPLLIDPHEFFSGTN